MINLNLLEKQIEEFIEVSGDDVSMVINHGDCLAFTHIALTKINFSYEITLSEDGSIKLTKQAQAKNKSAFDQDIEGATAETILNEVIVKEAKASNIQDVIAFVQGIN